MLFFPDLSTRVRQPEIMDQPDLARQDHFQALTGLGRINRWSGSARILWPAIRNLCQELAPRPVRVLDVATGGGDVPIQLMRKARRSGLSLEIAGCDISPQALDFAGQQAQKHGVDVRFFTRDALEEDLPQDFDVMTSSLFLHHLENEQAVRLLRRLGESTRHLVLINDLARGRWGLAAAHLACRLLTTSRVVRWDGPRSVEAAFTTGEALDLAHQAGLSGVVVARRWPFRYLLSWRKP